MSDQVSAFHYRDLLRVLIVDDVPEVRHDLSVLLQLTDEVQVVGEASNGAEAIDQAEALRPDVVIMDLEMPVMDGYAATRRVKAVSPGCRVIALTIHDGRAERQQALQAGMADVVVKGAPLEALLRAIGVATPSGRVWPEIRHEQLHCSDNDKTTSKTMNTKDIEEVRNEKHD